MTSPRSKRGMSVWSEGTSVIEIELDAVKKAFEDPGDTFVGIAEDTAGTL